MTPVCEPVPATGGRFSTRGQIILGACACAGATAFLYAVDPNRHAVYPQCLFYKVTGIYCAGCGATRALYALLHGRVLEALRDNALLLAALPVLVFVLGSFLLSAWRNNAWPKVTLEGRSLWRWGFTVLGLMLVFMAIRNAPGFEWLRPA